MKAEMLLFSNLIPRRPPKALFWYEILKIIFKKITNISNQNRASGGLLGIIFEKSNISAFTGKNYHSILFRKNLGFVTYLPKRGPHLFSEGIMFVVFSLKSSCFDPLPDWVKDLNSIFQITVNYYSSISEIASYVGVCKRFERALTAVCNPQLG